MILSAQTIRSLCCGSMFETARQFNASLRPLIAPFQEETMVGGRSGGISHAGYDIHIREGKTLAAGEFFLASTIEYFVMPNDLTGLLHDKSSWARVGLSLFNTVAEPGWEGTLTLELVNHGRSAIHIEPGSPIGQMIFCRLDQPTENPYPADGKYQRQPARPVPAILER
jgi:dCTP deaminase